MNNDYQPRLDALIADLRRKGSLTSDAVEQAMRAAPRHYFLPGLDLEKVYSDAALKVREGPDGRWTSSSSQPSIMTIMLEQLDLRPGMRVLEIGAGSGYNAALMAALVGSEGAVTTIDYQADLVEAARDHLRAAGFPTVQVIAGDGSLGYPPGAPYDRIILTASAAAIAPAFREQLVPGGRLVLPLNLGGPQVSTAFEKQGEDLVSLSLSSCGFMPLQGAFAGPQFRSIDLGPEPGLHIAGFLTPEDLPADLYDWLASPGPDYETGITVRRGELFNGLFNWLAVQPEPALQLIGDGPGGEVLSLPQLLYIGVSSEHRTRLTAILIKNTAAVNNAAARSTGAAALTLPRGRPAPYHDWSDDTPSPESTFDLSIRALGPHPEPAVQALFQALRAWDAASRPDVDQMHLRGVPQDKPIQKAPNQFILARPWTNFIVWFEK